MPAPELSYLLQTAVLWSAAGIGDYGQPTISNPTEIRVRWNDVQSEALDPQGNTITVDASAIVNRDVSIGSILWLGTLTNWVGTGSNDQNGKLMQVKTFNSTPDLKNRVARREVGLIRLRDTLPSVGA